ncbi:hypothetical protein [Paraburkholderia elongata]|uniref:Uncharacterized protein n=1 Tax=Paraburkholderia elongata TaxID=2675747 RepID=A0A972NT74_9BURK|nr:hypothetical protein [Paraburkholderia elongata]NPT58119.1 hypothetical protein [Paraburkholderia elongata]
MKVQDLLAQLALADPQAEVLFLDQCADADETDEVGLVDIRTESWTHERGTYGGKPYEARYPGNPCERESGYSGIVTSAERVVVLSAGPTNLRYLPT